MAQVKRLRAFRRLITKTSKTALKLRRLLEQQFPSSQIKVVHREQDPAQGRIAFTFEVKGKHWVFRCTLEAWLHKKTHKVKYTPDDIRFLAKLRITAP